MSFCNCSLPILPFALQLAIKLHVDNQPDRQKTVWPAIGKLEAKDLLAVAFAVSQGVAGPPVGKSQVIPATQRERFLPVLGLNLSLVTAQPGIEGESRALPARSRKQWRIFLQEIKPFIGPQGIRPQPGWVCGFQPPEPPVKKILRQQRLTVGQGWLVEQINKGVVQVVGLLPGQR